MSKPSVDIPYLWIRLTKRSGVLVCKRNSNNALVSSVTHLADPKTSGISFATRLG
jgi:hypothetical protein